MDAEPRVATDHSESARYDLGILFVHGIGDQQPGVTLADMAGPLVRWVHEWIGGPPNIEDVLNPNANACPVAYAKFGNVIVSNPGGPAGYAEVEVERRGVARRWLLAESRWSESFHAATPGKVAGWGLQIGAYAAAHHYVTSLERLISRSRHTALGYVFAILQAPLLILPALIMAVAVQLLSIVVLVLGPFPGGPLAGARERLRTWLATSVGDAAQLAQSDIQYASMASTVARDIGQLDRLCSAVVVVAHSQGAAVAWRALNTPIVPEVEALVTFGAGLNKLLVLRRAGALGAFLGVFVVLGALTLPITAWWALSTLTAVSVVPSWVSTWGPVALYPSILGLVALALLYFSIASQHQEPFPLRVRARRWIDLYASRDPVSNGPLARELPVSVSSEEVWNSNSLLADHTSYWSNREGFVSRIGMLALSIDGPPDANDIEWAHRGGRRRGWRLGVKRRTDQVALLTIVVALVALRDRLPDLGEAITQTLEGVPIILGGIGLLVTSAIAPIPAAAVATVAAAAVVLPATELVLGGALVVVAGLALKLVGDTVYRIWAIVDDHAWMRRKPYPATVPFLLMVAAFFGLTAATAIWLWVNSGDVPTILPKDDRTAGYAIFNSLVLAALGRGVLANFLRRIRPAANAWSRYFAAVALGFAGLWPFYSFVARGLPWQSPILIIGTFATVTLALILAWAIPTQWIERVNSWLDARSTRERQADGRPEIREAPVDPQTLASALYSGLAFGALALGWFDREMSLLIAAGLVYAWLHVTEQWSDPVRGTRYAAVVATTLIIAGVVIFIWRLLF